MFETSIKSIISKRFIEARKSLNLKQEDMAEMMGFQSRQIVSNIESGKRNLSAEELIKACDVLHKPLEYFTDPYIFNGEISWRFSDDEIDYYDCDTYAKNVIAAHLRFTELLDKKPVPINVQIPITKKSSYEGVSSIAESIVKNWDLGDVPALKLAEVSQEKLNLEILNISCPQGISGGACKVDEYNIILINSNEPAHRQNFNLAHELFHILTWDNLKPDKADYCEIDNDRPKEEKLANIFASSLLMPEYYINSLWEERPSNTNQSWFVKLAKIFQVSGQALIWRLINLKKLTMAIWDVIQKENLVFFLKSSFKLYSKNFVINVNLVIEKGLVSFSKIKKMLDLSDNEFVGLMESYGLKTSYGRI